MVFDQGMAVDYPLTMRHRDGTLTEVLYNASGLPGRRREGARVFAAARDVTDARQAFEVGSLDDRVEPGLSGGHQPGGVDHRCNAATVRVTRDRPGAS